jgi:hypothetical protein
MADVRPLAHLAIGTAAQEPRRIRVSNTHNTRPMLTFMFDDVDEDAIRLASTIVENTSA